MNDGDRSSKKLAMTKESHYLKAHNYIKVLGVRTGVFYITLSYTSCLDFFVENIFIDFVVPENTIIFAALRPSVTIGRHYKFITIGMKSRKSRYPDDPTWNVATSITTTHEEHPLFC